VLVPRWWCRVAAQIGVAARPGTRRPASYGHPRYRATATCVPDPGRCAPPADRPDNSSVPDCEARPWAARGTPADRTREGEKSASCVTTRRRQLWLLTSLGRELGPLTARALCLSVPGFGLGGLAMSSLSPRCLPAADFPLALWLLAVALVPTPRVVRAAASFAQADPRARSARSGPTAVLSRNVVGAHGRLNLPREQLGEDGSPFSPSAIKTRMRHLPASLSPPREQDRERNGLRNAPRRRHQD
jgi:hypothetical protein